MKDFILPSVVGLLSGILASMGMGGGFVLLVYLSIFTSAGQLDAQGINLFFFLPIIAVSVVLHLKNKLIDIKTALILGLSGAVTSAAGWYFAKNIEGDLHRKLFAVFLVIAGLKDLFSKSQNQQSQ